MKNVIFLPLIIVVFNLTAGFSQKNIMTTIHSDTKGGTTTPTVDNARYNNLKIMVDSATNKNIKLTIMLNPYFCGIILNDPVKYNQVQTWINNGHEIAGLHRGLTHYEWDGYTDLPSDTIIAYNSLSNYIGPMNIFNNWLDSIAQSPVNLFSTYDIVSEYDWKSGSFIQGTGGGMSAPASSAYYNVQSATVNQGNINICQVNYFFIDNTSKVSNLIALYSSQTEQNVGVVTHPSNFASNPSYFYNWLNFVESQQNLLTGVSKTASEIVQLSACVSTLNVRELYPSGINFSIHPNPAENSINVYGIQTKDSNYKIYSATGNLVMSSTLTNPIINIEKLSKGIYFIVLTNGTKTESMKFVKNDL